MLSWIEMDTRTAAFAARQRYNDRAVWEACGKALPIGDKAACATRLMNLYQQRMKA